MKEKIFKLKHDSNGDTMMNTLVSSAPPWSGRKKSVQKTRNEAEDEKGNLNSPYFLRISPIFPCFLGINDIFSQGRIQIFKHFGVSRQLK